MSSKSAIEWTEQTWNPTTGCTKISPGCKYCYAEVMAQRLCAMKARGYENGFEISLLPERLEQPLRRKKPTLYFVNSMSDLFHEEIDFDFLDQVFDVISQTPRHTYQILSKRAARMQRYFSTRTVPPNAWLGVTVEDREYGVPRIAHLKAIDARIKFLSCEPLLEALGALDLTGIQWVIVGGESGTKARPMQAEWAQAIQRQCQSQNVHFFFKQWGAWSVDGKRGSKKVNGRLLNGRYWNEMPELGISG